MNLIDDPVHRRLAGTPTLWRFSNRGTTYATPWLALEHADSAVLYALADKYVLARLDATEMLSYFARMQALSVLEHWTEEPADVVLDWLLTGDEQYREAAYSAARSAAYSLSLIHI